MENTMNDNYGTDNRNSQDGKRTNESENSKLNDYRNQDDFVDNNPESFYSNDKNSDPQKSDYTSEADLSNQEEEEDEAEDIDDFDDIELDADRPDFQEVENEGVLEEDDELDELDEDELDEDELDEDELDEDEVYDPDAINNQDYLNSRTFI